MSDHWLVFMIAGLCMDICGIIILLGPILYNEPNRKKKLIDDIKNTKAISLTNNVFRYYQPWHSSDKDIHVLYKKLIDKEIAMTIELLQHQILQLTIFLYAKDRWLFRTAKSALVIIVMGFLLQIIGNAMKT